MNIMIDEHYKVTSDNFNYRLEKLSMVKNKKTGDEIPTWKLSLYRPYHITVGGALEAYVDIKMKESKKKVFPSFIKEMREIESQMRELLKIVEIMPLNRKG